MNRNPPFGKAPPHPESNSLNQDPPTPDTFFDGSIRVRQPRRGYRFSIDAVILAGCLHPRPGDSMVDLGTGCGIVPILLAHRRPGVRIWGVEVQAELASLAVENVRANAMERQVSILNADLRDVPAGVFGGPVDWVVSNPPYRRGRSGRVNPNTQRALARHEIAMTLPDLVTAARRLLRTGGRFVAIYAAERIADLLFHLRSERIEPKRLQAIHPDRHSNARLILVEGVKNGRPGAALAPPLIIREESGRYSAEIDKMISP
jgi:tRNA1Val (adenine37-N6)-methyltransferase